MQVKQLEFEDRRLKRMYAELALENEAIKGCKKLSRGLHAGTRSTVWSAQMICPSSAPVER
jgi:hypothetical protein